jgi:KipI family sensor histidine kinase inhibitor
VKRAPTRWVGDRAILVEFGEGAVSVANERARALSRLLGGLRLPEVEDLVPAARTLLVLLREGAAPGTRLLEVLSGSGEIVSEGDAGEGRVHEIEVEYGGAAGPDLAEVSRVHGLDESRVIELHASALYTVGFLGFAPGFTYLFGLPAALATPRLSTPRTRVPAGSVAIGGEFSGIYPRATPGGWRLIGRTETELFSVDRDPPSRLAPGDRVRFVPR